MADKSEYKGMTIRQIRQRKALVELKKELATERLQNDMYKLRQTFNFKGSGLTKATNVVDTVFGKGSTYLRYFMFGVTAYKSVKSVVNLFSKKKR